MFINKLINYKINYFLFNYLIFPDNKMKFFLKKFEKIFSFFKIFFILFIYLFCLFCLFQTTNIEGSSVVEKLTFYNHTECECRERTELGGKSEKTSETRFARHHPPLTPQNLRKSPPKKP